MWAPLGLAVSLVCAGTGKAHLAGALCPPPASPSTPTPALWAAQPFLREGGDGPEPQQLGKVPWRTSFCLEGRRAGELLSCRDPHRVL